MSIGVLVQIGNEF